MNADNYKRGCSCFGLTHCLILSLILVMLVLFFLLSVCCLGYFAWEERSRWQRWEEIPAPPHQPHRRWDSPPEVPRPEEEPES